MLTICATGGLDFVAEENIVRLTQYSDKCCLIHALDSVSVSSPGFDFELMATLISLRKVFQRVSPAAIDFICLCMQQRFTDKELERFGQTNKRMGKPSSTQELLASPWLSDSVPQK